MKPVILSAIEGKNFLLGTFDTNNLVTWWKSEPFPGAISKINEPLHVYGQYHICIVKMSNGTYSIYRTTNMGKSWSMVYNTNDIIYTLTLIDYGWVVASTSTGWIESKLDSGYTWSKISSFAPGCKTVINIDDDILFAYDGYHVWRSIDYAKTWSKILSTSSFEVQDYYGLPGSTVHYSNYSQPALAGINKYVFVAVGPYLIISDDLGKTWHRHWAYAYESGSYHVDYGTVPPFGHKFKSKILQIIITNADIKPEKCSLLCRVLLTDSNSVEYWYCGPETQVSSVHSRVTGYQTLGSMWKKKFSYPYKGIENGRLDSCDVLRPGSTEKEMLVSFSTYDSSNNPIVKYSDTAGYTWESLSPSSVTVYEGDPNNEVYSQKGQSIFNEEYFTTYTWIGLSCHNKGYYKIDYNKTVRGISADLDLITGFLKTKQLSSNLMLKIPIKELSFDTDNLLKKTIINNYNINSAIISSDRKTFLVGSLLQDNLGFDSDIITSLSSRLSSEYDIYMYAQAANEKYTFYDIAIFTTPEKAYGMETKLIDDHVEQVMNSIERYSWQAPDVRYPDIPYNVYDSRNQSVTP